MSVMRTEGQSSGWNESPAANLESLHETPFTISMGNITGADWMSEQLAATRQL
jgi:hypothetical protein